MMARGRRSARGAHEFGEVKAVFNKVFINKSSRLTQAIR
ncbi:Uncharacterised protein [Vibrio cholerae]|nr:Uncharacterised protein [Vibrio cholerae]CSC47329.1 Uncharacterised protein [Vibrio cholerae]CSC88731.1 Uncharacterised protein [Vibrio cholerae]